MNKLILITCFSFFFILNLLGNNKLSNTKDCCTHNTMNNYFSLTEVPDKWKNESAVIIFQERNFSFSKKGKKAITKEKIRKRIKLLDNTAVEEFSEFYFVENDTSIKIKIIKTSNEIINVKTNNAVKVTENIPDFFKSDRLESYTYNKLAIPNIEVGDIIDYEYCEIDEDLYFYIYTLTSKFPIMHQRYIFSLDKGFNMNIKLFNNAPKLVSLDEGKTETEMKKLKTQTYMIEDHDREKTPNIPWLNLYSFSPYFKFIVTAKKITKNKEFNVNKKQKTIYSDTVSINEIREIVNDNIDDQYQNAGSIHGTTYSTLFSIMRDSCDFRKLANYYDIVRYTFVRLVLANENKLLESYYPNKYMYNQLISMFFKVGFKYQTLISSDRRFGGLKNIVSEQELIIGYKIFDTKNDNVYYWFPRNNVLFFGSIPSEIQGSEVLLYNDIDDKNEIPEKTTFPLFDADSNKHLTISKIKINDDFEKVSFNRKFEISGNLIEEFYDKYLNYYSIYMENKNEYSKKYKWMSMDFDSKQDFKKESIVLKDKLIEKLKKYYSDAYEFTIASYDGYQLRNEARLSTDRKLFIEENFIATNMINNVAKDYMLNIGWLVGEQIKIKNDNYLRLHDLYFSYPRVYENIIIMTIPENYKINNINSLNLNIDNESGSFTSKAELVDNELHISTKKTYKKYSDSKNNWSNYIAFTDLAHDFSQKKILLVKK